MNPVGNKKMVTKMNEQVMELSCSAHGLELSRSRSDSLYQMECAISKMLVRVYQGMSHLKFSLGDNE